MKLYVFGPPAHLKSQIHKVIPSSFDPDCLTVLEILKLHSLPCQVLITNDPHVSPMKILPMLCVQDLVLCGRTDILSYLRDKVTPSFEFIKKCLLLV